MRPGLTLTLVSALFLGGCGFSGIGSGDSGLFGGGGLRGTAQDVEGIRFRTRIGPTTEDDRGFAVSVSGAARSLAAAQEAGRVDAVAYCLKRFGGSEIAWTAGPDLAPEQVALGDRGSLTMAGTCLHR